MRWEVGGASAPATFFREQQPPASSGEGTASSREGITESQADDAVSSVDTPPSFSTLSDLDGGEGDVPARNNSQLHPSQNRSLSGNAVTAGRTRHQTRHAQPPSAHTREGTRIEAMVTIAELKNFGGVLRTEAAGSRVIFKTTTEIEHQIQCLVSRQRVLRTHESLIVVSVPRLVCTWATLRVYA